jgi:ABC-type antimicrobial peptide transport system permease subunit
MGITLIRGREFESRDDLGAPKVALVNQAFARKFNLGDDAVGKFMQAGSGGENDTEIIGLVEDAKYSEVKGVTPPLFFGPYRQDERLGQINFYVRSNSDPVALLGSLRRVVSGLDQNLPIEGLQTMPSQVRDNIFLDRMLSILSASFAVLASLLAAVGLYGVLAYAVAQRRREIGLRMALGADGGRVGRMILKYVGWMTFTGAAVGLVAAFGLGRVASSLLFGIEGNDPGVFSISLALLLFIAFVATLGPVLRATRISPMEALRDD